MPRRPPPAEMPPNIAPKWSVSGTAMAIVDAIATASEKEAEPGLAVHPALGNATVSAPVPAATETVARAGEVVNATGTGPRARNAKLETAATPPPLPPYPRRPHRPFLKVLIQKLLKSWGSPPLFSPVCAIWAMKSPLKFKPAPPP